MNAVTQKSRPIHRMLAAFVGLVFASSAEAQLADLNVSDGGAPPCTPGVNNVASFDSATPVAENILALTNPAGAPVFWELGFVAGFPSTVACTPTPAAGFVKGYTCANGLSISLPPAVLDETTSVSSVQPVTVTTSAGASVGTAQFSLTATQDGGAFPTCQNFYQVDLLATKKPFDLVFVLDKSGSMTETIDGGDTRWDALETGVETFLPFIEGAARPPTPPGSRVGLTFFDTTVNPKTTGMFDVLSGQTTSTAFQAIPNTLNLTPGGWTAMGLGLKDGVAKANGPNKSHVVVLFSDGEQNEAPEITLDGCSYTNPAGKVTPNCPSGPGETRIVTVGIGGVVGDYFTTLVNLGGNHGGSAVFTDNGSDFTGTGAVPNDIGATFQNTIGAALQGNSPQQISNAEGLVQPDPSQPNVLPSFRVNRSADAVSLSFAFSQRFETPQLLELMTGIRVKADGVDVTAEFRPMIYGNFSNVLTLVRDARPATEAPRALEGDYEVSLALPGDSFKRTLEFRLFAYVEDQRFKARATVDDTVPRVNAPINVDLQLDWLNLGVEGATVVVRAFTPGQDMGDLLSQGEAVELSDADDAGNPGTQKYDHLAASDPNFLAALALSPNAIAMTDQGGGRYSGSFTLPDTVGAVHLVYDVIADNPDLFGRVQRHWYETIYARFDSIDLSLSDLTSAWVENGLQLDAVFRRPSGLPLGPGQVNGFAFDGATLLAAEDLQDGRYRFVLDANDPGTEISITLGGDEVYTGPVGWGAGPKMTIDRLLQQMPIWLWLILLLVLLLILWFVRRIFGPTTP
jgi:hypothetical protein